MRLERAPLADVERLQTEAAHRDAVEPASEGQLLAEPVARSEERLLDLRRAEAELDGGLVDPQPVQLPQDEDVPLALGQGRDCRDEHACQRVVLRCGGAIADRRASAPHGDGRRGRALRCGRSERATAAREPAHGRRRSRRRPSSAPSARRRRRRSGHPSGSRRRRRAAARSGGTARRRRPPRRLRDDRPGSRPRPCAGETGSRPFTPVPRRRFCLMVAAASVVISARHDGRRGGHRHGPRRRCPRRRRRSRGGSASASRRPPARTLRAPRRRS